MLLDVRDTVVPAPATSVPSWVAEEDVSTKLTASLATLIVYDAGERPFCVNFVAWLSHASKLSHLTKRYFARLLLT